MNKELTNRVCHYLALDTNYAIIINGNYGIGKTYYIKNELFPAVKIIKTPFSEDSNETFKPILVSLFGAKSIEDIQNQIFLELHPKLKSKGAKIVSGLGKGVFKYFGAELNDVIKEIGPESFLDYRKILICIDDIDRKSDELNLKEVFGFINNLVENLEAKVILVANEDYLRNEFKGEDNVYSLLREKVIGISVNYKTNVSKIYDEIISTKYKKNFDAYYKFLRDNKNLILNRIKQNDNNLRNLIFFLEHFKIVYSSLINFLGKNKSYLLIAQDLKDQILNFTLPLSIEYKKGELSPLICEELKENYQRSFLNFKSIVGDENSYKPTQEEVFAKSYREKYIENSRSSKYFDSIFNYIIGEHFFDQSKLEDDIKEIYSIENDKLPRQEILLQKLSYWQCLNLNFQKYRKYTFELLKFVDKGDFPLHQYTSIFAISTRFENLLDYDIPKLVERFEKGIERGFKKYDYVPSLHMKISYESTHPYATELKQVSSFCLEQNEKKKKELEAAEIDKLFSLIKSQNPSEFLVQISDFQGDFRYQPVFAYINFSKFWKAIKDLENSFMIDLAYSIGNRYRNQAYPDLNPDLEFLNKLNRKLEEVINNKTISKIDKVAYRFLKDKVEISITNFVSE